VSPPADLWYQLPRQGKKFPQAEGIIRVDDIQQMMGGSASLQGRGFGGANVQATVHLPAVGVDYLAAKLLTESDRQSGFAGGGGANDG